MKNKLNFNILIFIILIILLFISCSIIPRFNNVDIESDNYEEIPENLEVSYDEYSTKIELSWDELYYAKKYLIFRSTSENISDDDYIAETSTTTYSDHDEDLIANTEYYYSLKAVLTNDKETDFSEVEVGERTENLSKKSKPYFIDTKEVTRNVRPRWTWEVDWDNSNDATFYYYLDGINVEGITTNSFFEPTTDLTDDTFTLYLTAIDEKGDYTGEVEKSITVTTVNPLSLEASKAAYPGSITLEWDWIDHVSYYEIYRSEDNTTDFDLVTYSLTNFFNDNHPDLLPQKKYYYYIKGVFPGDASTDRSNIDIGCLYSPWVTDVENLPTQRSYHATLAYNNKIFIIGKLYGYKTMEVYDPSTDQWDDSSNYDSISQERGNHIAEVVNGKFYVMGGIIGTSFSHSLTDTIEVYDVTSDNWSVISPTMPYANQNMQSVVYGDNIYMIGGMTSEDTADQTNDIYKFDTNNLISPWTFVTKIPTNRHEFSASILGDKIYIIGGSNINTNNKLDLVEIYDISDNSWTTGTPMIDGRSNFISEVVKNKIVVLCGSDNYQSEMYDPITDSWTELSDTDYNINSIDAAVLNNLIYIPGVGNTDLHIYGLEYDDAFYP